MNKWRLNMPVAKADIVIEITFNLNEPEKSVIKTNAKAEALEELLETWLECQIGKGADSRSPNQKSEYKIRISLDLSDDTFYTNSDTGNNGLTWGLVMEVFKRLNSLQVLPLS